MDKSYTPLLSCHKLIIIISGHLNTKLINSISYLYFPHQKNFKYGSGLCRQSPLMQRFSGGVVLCCTASLHLISLWGWFDDHGDGPFIFFVCRENSDSLQSQQAAYGASTCLCTRLQHARYRTGCGGEWTKLALQRKPVPKDTKSPRFLARFVDVCFRSLDFLSFLFVV